MINACVLVYYVPQALVPPSVQVPSRCPVHPKYPVTPRYLVPPRYPVPPRYAVPPLEPSPCKVTSPSKVPCPCKVPGSNSEGESHGLSDLNGNTGLISRRLVPPCPSGLYGKLTAFGEAGDLAINACALVSYGSKRRGPSEVPGPSKVPSPSKIWRNWVTFGGTG